MSNIDVCLGKHNPLPAANVVLQFLAEEGYRPRFDEDDDVVFKSEGHTYIVWFDRRDTEFVRVVFPNFWSLDSDEETQQAREVIEEVNRSVKVAKLGIIENRVSTTVEVFFGEPETLPRVLLRIIGAMQTATKEFVDAMRQRNAAAP